jgi:hypothetical protein
MDIHESYINGITATYFGAVEVNDPQISITQAGWYWADNTDNARYSDWKGVYTSKYEAMEAGRNERRAIIEDLKKMV